MKLALNHAVRCADGTELTLGDVIIDPRSRAVTHVVVQPGRHHDDARLAPFSDLSSDPTGDRSDGDVLVLAGSASDLERYPLLTEISVVGPNAPIEPGAGWTVGTQDVVPMPMGEPMMGVAMVTDQVTVRWDRIPTDEVEVRHSSAIYSQDGHRLGSVDGLICGPDGIITELVLKHGLLFARRDVVVPAEHLVAIGNDQLILDLTREELRRFGDEPLDDWLEP